MHKPYIVCPLCKSCLDHTSDGVFCDNCSKLFPFKKGILCFGFHDEFYEGKFTSVKDWCLPQTNRIKRIFKFINLSISISTFESRFFKNALKQFLNKNQAYILDFGCGGGMVTLAAHANVTGVDLSVASLINAQKIYHQVYQIDGEHLPFPDSSFDGVYSTHVFGHIPKEIKPSVIAQIFRVLKPGGYLIGSIECDSESIIYSRAKKFPKLFSKCYIEQWGHYGLELPEANFERFREAGFLPVIEFADIHKGYLRPVSSYKILRDYKNKDTVLFWLGEFSNWIDKSHVLTRVIDIVFGMMVPVAYLFTPPNHRDSAKVVYQKPEC